LSIISHLVKLVYLQLPAVQILMVVVWTHAEFRKLSK